MADDFYPFVDSGDPAPDNTHITGVSQGTPVEADAREEGGEAPRAAFATRIAIYDDMFSTPRVVVIEPTEVRPYLEEVTNTVYRCMKEQGGAISLMVIREIVENFIHAHFMEPIISILDGGQTIRFADQGPGIADKERAFEFGVTSADRDMKRYIRGTGAGFPMVQQYLEAAGGAVSIEDNLGAGTVVTVSLDPARVEEIKRNTARGAAVRGAAFTSSPLERGGGQAMAPSAPTGGPQPPYEAMPPYGGYGQMPQVGVMAPGGIAGVGAGYGAAQAAAVPNPAAQQQTPVEGAAPAPQGAWPYPSYPYQGNMGSWPTAWGTMPAPAYQQGYHSFSTSQQPAGIRPFPQPAQPHPEASGTPGAQPFVSERGRLALAFLFQQGQAGPKELAAAFGNSGPTWSRELATLGECGFVIKHGQKYHLTELGSSWIQARGGDA